MSSLNKRDQVYSSLKCISSSVDTLEAAKPLRMQEKTIQDQALQRAEDSFEMRQQSVIKLVEDESPDDQSSSW